MSDFFRRTQGMLTLPIGAGNDGSSLVPGLPQSLQKNRHWPHL